MDPAASLLEDVLLDYDDSMDVGDNVKNNNVDGEKSDINITVASPQVPCLQEATTAAEVVTPSSEEKVEASGSKNSPTSRKCVICTKNHPLRFCRKFRAMTIERRLRMVAFHRICARCLATDHVTRNCKSSGKCTICNQPHSSLLHGHDKTSHSMASRNRRSKSAPGLHIRESVSISPTLRVNLITSSKIPVRAVLDACCQHSYICSDLVERMKIPRLKIGSDFYCRVEIASIHDNSQRVTLLVRIYKMNAIRTPSTSISEHILESFPGLQLADPYFYRSSGVALVLGPEIISKIIQGRIQSNPGLPLAQYTIFGWIISGVSPF